MSRARFPLVAATVLLLGCVPVFAQQDMPLAVDLEHAPQTATQLISQLLPTPGADLDAAPFDVLASAYQALRGWAAFSQATHLARLPSSSGLTQGAEDAVKAFAAVGITKDSLALAALDAMNRAGDAPGAVVANNLSLASEMTSAITLPSLRLKAKALLGIVALRVGDNDAAADAFNEAVSALAATPSAQSVAYLDDIAELALTLGPEGVVDRVARMVMAVSRSADRSAILARLGHSPAFGEALQAAATRGGSIALIADILAATSKPALANKFAQAVSSTVDPAPTAMLLAALASRGERLAACDLLVGKYLAAGFALRAANMLRIVPVDDCAPRHLLDVGINLAARGLRGPAVPLLASYLERAGNAPPQGEDKERLAQLLVSLAQPDLLELNAAALERIYGADLTRIRGQVAVTSVLAASSDERRTRTDAAGAMTNIDAASKILIDIIAGRMPGTAVPDEFDGALTTAVGASLSEQILASGAPAAFLTGTAPLTMRHALAQGIASRLSFDAGRSVQLTDAMAGIARLASDEVLLASLGKATPGQISVADLDGKTALGRLARQLAWQGRSDEARALLGAVVAGSPYVADIAAIDAVVGDFDTGVASLRSIGDVVSRQAYLRFVAEERAARLSQTLSAPPIAIGNEVPVIETIAASASYEAGQLRIAGTPKVAAPAAPQMPDLGVSSANVLNLVPAPVGGSAGLTVGGEGRYIRLARFDSPIFEGDSSKGVRDFVFRQAGSISPEYLMLDHGVFTLADILASVGPGRSDVITMVDGNKTRLNRPIAIGPDATLILSGSETAELQLNVERGIYIVNAGRLFVAGVRVVAYSPSVDAVAYVRPGSSSDAFRPFILGWSGSRTYAADSEFVALGYSAGRSYGFSMTSGPDDDYLERSKAAPPTGVIVNNSFDNLYYGYYAYEAEGAAVVGNEYRDSVIYGLDPHDRSRHLNLSLNATYGSAKKHGIIISREVDDSAIVGNLSFDNHGSGIMLDRSSVGTLVAANTLRGNHGDGLAVFESPCALVTWNDISGNNRSGILIRNSWDVALVGNRLTANKSAGVLGFISDLATSAGSYGRNFKQDPYQPVTAMAVIDNEVSRNGAGIQTMGTSLIVLSGNKLLHQSHRLYGGDLSAVDAALLRYQKSERTLVSTSCRPVLATRKVCRWIELGLVEDLLGADTTTSVGDYCTSGNTLQSQAMATGGAS